MDSRRNEYALDVVTLLAATAVAYCATFTEDCQGVL